MLLPNEINPALTRELLFTGIIRAKHDAEVWGSDGIIRECIAARVERMSGLGDEVYSE